MTELDRVRDLLARAEQAAMSGNFPSADELLKEAARVQEKELGPGHPDLANTLNNLAIIAEKTGRVAEAEMLYRRSASIAAAALPPGHPMIVESRQNLADFCRAHRVPIDVPAPRVPVDLPKPVTPPSKSNHDVTAVASEILPEPPRPPTTAAPSNKSRSPAWLAGAAVLLVAVVLLVWRPWSSREAPAEVNASETKAEQPTEAVPRPTTAPPENSAAERTPPPKAVPPDRARQVTSPKPPAAAITLAVAQVCRSFSTSGSNWRCEPVGSSVKPGPMVLYTRVKSPRDTTVVHRWYNGKTLRQSVKLSIRGNATEGYRTYSRQTVSDGDWRVEVRSADDALLHEQRFVVR